MKKPGRHSKKGQSLVEFIMVVTIFINLLIVTFNAVLAFSVHQYISYATFMAARAFQAAGSDPQEQSQRAQAVLDSYLTSSDGRANVLRFEGFGKDLATEIVKMVPQNPEKLTFAPQLPAARDGGSTSDASIQVDFSVPLFEARLGSFGKNLLNVRLSAISYLGREPTQVECQNFFKGFYNYFLPRDALAGAGGLPADSAEVVKEGWRAMEDNGC